VSGFLKAPMSRHLTPMHEYEAKLIKFHGTFLWQ